MELRLLVEVGAATPREVAVELEAAHPIGELAAALARHIGLEVEDPTLVRRDVAEVTLDPGAAVGDAGLLVGDRVEIRPAGPRTTGEVVTTPPTARFASTAGPDAGRAIDLHPGTYTVGRSDEADLTLLDPFLSRVHLRLEATDRNVMITDAGSSNGTLLGAQPVERRPLELDASGVVTAGSSRFALRSPPRPRPHAPSRDGTVGFDRMGRTRTDPKDDAAARPSRGLRRLLRRTGDEAGEAPDALDPLSLLTLARQLRPGLWYRRPGEREYLTVRCGWGEPAVGIDLRREGGVAVAASERAARRLARWMVTQLAGWHSPEDVSIVIATGHDQRDGWRFATWIPHVRQPHGGMALDAGEASAMLSALSALVDERDEAGRDPARMVDHDVVIVLDARLPLDAGRLHRIATAGTTTRVHVIVHGPGAAEVLPGAAVIRDRDDGTVEVVDGRTTTVGGGIDGVGHDVALQIALALAPLREAQTRTTSLPDVVELLPLLNLEAPYPDGIIERWTRSRPGVSATIGATDVGPVTLDLDPDVDATVVIGDAGTGKTELLRSLVASLAATHPPDQLRIIVLDGGGGALRHSVAGVPHVRTAAVGSRSGDDDARRLIRRDDHVPVVVVLDAGDRAAVGPFAEELADRPDPGTHVVFAARNLDAVPAPFLTSASARIALHTDAETSRRFIGSTIAVGLPREGRAVLVTDTTGPLEFVTAHVTGHTTPDGASNIRVTDLDFGRPGDTSATSSTRNVSFASLETDLQRLVRVIVDAASNYRPRERAVGEPVRRTFLFTDIVDSTALLEAIGDQAWVPLLRWHDDTLVAEFQEHRGEVVDQAGDGFFVSFEDPDLAVACAVAIQRRLDHHRREHGFAPRVRMGLHLDEVLYDGRYRGRGVHIAARIAAQAHGDEILASPPVIEATAPSTLASRHLDLKGIAEGIDATLIAWSESVG